MYIITIERRLKLDIHITNVDKETKKIPDSVMIYGTIIALFKTIYNVCFLKSQFTDRVVVIDEVFFFLEQWVLCMVIPAILILVDYISNLIPSDNLLNKASFFSTRKIHFQTLNISSFLFNKKTL